MTVISGQSNLDVW